MNCENYEKKYKEALERAKKQREDYQKELDKTGKNTQLAGLLRAGISAIELAFPELAESEDERIRKALLDYYGKQCDMSDVNGVYAYEVCAWLEKQKINTEGDFGRGYDCGYEACLNSHGAEWFEKQKEQKPNTDFVIKPHKGDDNNPYDMSVSEAQEYAINRGFGIPFNDGEVYVDERHMIQTIGNILRWADEHPKEQKPVDYEAELKKCKDNPLYFYNKYVSFKQKPVEYLSKDKVYAIMNKLTELSTSDLIPIESEEYVKIHEITSDVCSLLNYPIEQKPDTRDSDDLQLLGFIYDLLNEIEWKDEWAMSKEECLRRINNYRPQKPLTAKEYHDKFDEMYANPVEQKTKEWSENTMDEFTQNIRNLITDKLTVHTKSLDGSEISSTVFIDDKTAKDIASGILFYVGKEAMKNSDREIPEWSEEDEKTINNACCWIAEYAGYLMDKNYSKASMLMSLTDKLKSLRPQKPAEWDELQAEFRSINEAFEDGKKEVVAHPEKYGLCKPREWSEEDERNFYWISTTIQERHLTPEYTKQVHKILTWLKSLRPSWKPTEEQMDSLRDTIVQTKGYSYSMYLPELYEQLKKLI